MKFIKVIFLFFFIINFSKEISSNDFNYFYPNEILKGSIIDFEIEFNEGILEWNNSIPIKIGDNNINLEKCNSDSKTYVREVEESYIVNVIKCKDILLDGDNTEISYGGVVQTGTNLNISFFDEFSINYISEEYLVDNKYEYFYINLNIEAGLKYRTVKLGNYVANCSSSGYYYVDCYIKIDEIGTYTLTIDGKEYKLNEGTENERIASINVCEFKITELPIFPVNSIEDSETLTFYFKMLHNEIADRFNFKIGSNSFYCYSSNDEKNNVKCEPRIYLQNRGKEKEIQYFYYYDYKNEKYIQTNASIIVTGSKTLKIYYYYIRYNDYYADYIFRDVKTKIEFSSNLNTLFDKNKDKIKIGNNELFQCNRSSSDSENIYCYGIFTESTLKDDGSYEYLNITLNGEDTGLSTYVKKDDRVIIIKSIKLKNDDYYINKEDEKNFILNIDSTLLTEKCQISLRKNKYENKRVLSCKKTDNINEINCLGIISESGEYYVYINDDYENNCNSIYFNGLSTIKPIAIIVNKTTECILFESVNELDLNNFVLTSNEKGKSDGIVENCSKIDSFQIKCSITIPNIGIYNLKNENNGNYYNFGEVYCTNEYISEIYSISPNIFYLDKENQQYFRIKVDANYDVSEHIFKLVPTNSSLDSFIIFCSSYDYFYIECRTYFEEIGEYTLYFDNIKQNLNVYVIDNKTKIISEIYKITPKEINFTSSNVSFELTSNTNFLINYQNLSLNLNENFSYYLQCEPSSNNSFISICITQLKSFGSFYLKSNNENFNIIIFNNIVKIYGPQILNITPLNFNYDFYNYQKFEITYSSNYGDYFDIILKGNKFYNQLKPNYSKINSTNIECDVIFKYEDIYNIKINGLETNFTINVEDEYKDEVVHEEYEEYNYNINNNFYKLFILIYFLLY